MFAFFDWIFLGLHMSSRVYIGIFRMWILSAMHFEVGIHILIRSCERITRRFVRWRADGGTHSRRVMDGVFRHVPLLTLIQSERRWLLRMNDRGVDLRDGGFSGIR